MTPRKINIAGHPAGVMLNRSFCSNSIAGCGQCRFQASELMLPNFIFFRRVNSDLTMQMHISLVEALCGFQKPIKTLDDRTIVISAIPGNLCSVALLSVTCIC